MLRTALLATALTVSLGACTTSSGVMNEATEAVGGVIDGAVAEARLAAAVSGPWRNPDNVARDGYRHPGETLRFFGVMPDDTVIEITPGGGWYAEILAPYLREDGQYVAAVVDPMALPEGRGRDYQANSKAGLETLFAGSAAQYDRARIVAFDPANPVFGAAGSADAVLTFRNVHNWMAGGYAEKVFAAMFKALKPGGILGVEEHRGDPELPRDLSLRRVIGRDGQTLLEEVPVREVPDRHLFLVLDLENPLRSGEVPVPVVRLQPQSGARADRSLPELAVAIHQPQGVVVQIDDGVDARCFLQELLGALGKLPQRGLSGADGIDAYTRIRLRPGRGAGGCDHGDRK